MTDFQSIDYEFLLPLISRVPAPMAYRLAELRGRIMYHRRAASRETAVRNIMQTFPGLPEREARAIAVTHYEAQSVDEMESFWFSRDPAFFDKYTSVEGLDLLQSVAAGSKGALLLIAHWGSLGMFFVALGKRGLKFYVVGRPIDREDDSLHPAHLKWGLTRLRLIGDAIGHPLLFTGAGNFQKMGELLHSGNILTTAFDVTPHILTRAVSVTFFGRKAYFPAGLVRLQQESGCRVFYGSVDRFQLAPYQRIRITELISQTDGEWDLMQHLAGILESKIRQRPGEWTLWDSVQWFYDAPQHRG